jgi:hypothetical protein
MQQLKGTRMLRKEVNLFGLSSLAANIYASPEYS